MSTTPEIGRNTTTVAPRRQRYQKLRQLGKAMMLISLLPFGLVVFAINSANNSFPEGKVEVTVEMTSAIQNAFSFGEVAVVVFTIGIIIFVYAAW